MKADVPIIAIMGEYMFVFARAAFGKRVSYWLVHTAIVTGQFTVQNVPNENTLPRLRASLYDRSC